MKVSVRLLGRQSQPCVFPVGSAQHRVAAAVTVALLVLSCGGIDAEETAGTEKSFAFTADPSVELLSFRYAGGSITLTTSYSLYADGRLLIQISDPGGQHEVVDSYEYSLSYSQVEDLLRLVVDSGFADSDTEQIRQKMVESRGPAMPKAFDAADVILRIYLDSY